MNSFFKHLLKEKSCQSSFGPTSPVGHMSTLSSADRGLKSAFSWHHSATPDSGGILYLTSGSSVSWQQGDRETDLFRCDHCILNNDCIWPGAVLFGRQFSTQHLWFFSGDVGQEGPTGSIRNQLKFALCITSFRREREGMCYLQFLWTSSLNAFTIWRLLSLISWLAGGPWEES